MGIRRLKATTNGQRDMHVLDFEQLTAKKPSVKSLLKSKNRISGRSGGTISIRHRGGGARRHYRIVDFNGREKLGVPGKVAAVEYDPNRTAFIALINYADGDKRYRLAHKGIEAGQPVITDVKAKALHGNRMEVQHVPVGFPVYNIEMKVNKGGQMVRSAGGEAKLVSLEGDMAQIELPSGEIRLIHRNCMVTIGTLSKEEHSLRRIGKAGKIRHKGRRPQVRGKAMNPCDHPHGGGEGGCPIGLKHPKTPWGACALGVKTRSNKDTEQYILRSRHRAKKK